MPRKTKKIKFFVYLCTYLIYLFLIIMNELDESGTVYLFESAVNCSGKTKTFEAPRNFIQV